jgi:hypothetical protein
MEGTFSILSKRAATTLHSGIQSSLVDNNIESSTKALQIELPVSVTVSTSK